jgi:hypothetical protein
VPSLLIVAGSLAIVDQKRFLAQFHRRPNGSTSEIRSNPRPSRGGFVFSSALPFIEILLVLVRLDQVASFIVNADHSIV